MKIKKRIFEIIQVADPNDNASKIFDTILMVLILLNVGLVIADTFALPQKMQTVSKWIEIVSVVIFTLEYLLRIWTANYLYPGKNYFVAMIKYLFSFLAIVDLLAILPFYLPLIFSIDLRVLRMLRITRLFRVFKINRYTDAFKSILEVLRNKKEELFSSIFVVLLLMVIAAVLMYGIENKAQPEVFKNAFDSLWWALATLTTVGYGDIYPITNLGKILGSIISLLGIGLVAVPTGIISSGFMEIVKKKEEKEKTSSFENIKYCPYCGKKIDL